MITISDFSPKIYFIKFDNEITLKEVEQVPEVIKLVDDRNFELKLDEHGIWILHLHDCLTLNDK